MSSPWIRLLGHSMRTWTKRNIPKPLLIPYAGQAISAVKAKLLAKRWFDTALPLGSVHKTGFVVQMQKALQAGGCFCLASLVQGLLQTEENDVGGIQCPTLAIHGDSDFSHRHTDFGSIVDQIPHAQVVTFQGCGHFPNLERPSEYVGHVRRFLLRNG